MTADIDRRTAVMGLAALASSSGLRAAGPRTRSFPRGFLWGAATAGHQIEGNNVNADLWVLENVKPTVFAEPSGDALNSLELWPVDLDLARRIGLNSYRFSLEWSRIEPERGMFSHAMLDHYKAVITGCRARGLAPVVTFNHFTTPRWFAAQGGWAQQEAPALFARFCERAARHLHEGIAYAITLNQPNTPQTVASALSGMGETVRGMLKAGARAVGSDRYSTLLFFDQDDYSTITANLLAAHRQGRAAIKSVASHVPTGLTLALPYDDAVGPNSIRDRIRRERYGVWMDVAREDDFIGVQNYNRTIWDAKGMVPAPPGQEVYPPSLAGAVRFAHESTGRPVLVTEHGASTDDDRMRAGLIVEALRHLKIAIDDGIPVLGYLHWSLLDNYEWLFGFKRRFGLCSVDRTTFRRTPKPSAHVLGRMARRNAL